MTETIATLKEERNRLLARLDHLDQLLSRYEEWEREAAVVLTGVVTSSASTSMSAVPASAELKEEGTSLPEFQTAATEMFAATDAPLQRSEAFNRLTAAGVFVVGKEPLNVMTTRFNRMANIINLKGHGYWLKDRPYPPAAYEPDREGKVESRKPQQVDIWGENS